jgi:hypothetical protein
VLAVNIVTCPLHFTWRHFRSITLLQGNTAAKRCSTTSPLLAFIATGSKGPTLLNSIRIADRSFAYFIPDETNGNSTFSGMAPN